MRSARMRLGRRIAETLRRSWRTANPEPFVETRDLAEIEKLLLDSGAGGLVASRLRGSPLEATTAGRRLRDLYRHQVLGDAVREKRLAQVWTTLKAAGVEPLLGKGWAVARCYPEPGLRPCGDIDLYVRLGEYERARAALGGDGNNDVDLHRGLAELDDRDEARVVARSRLALAGTVEIRVFGPEDQLRLVALHAMRHGLIRPLWLCDVAVLVERRPADFDWDHFLTGSRTRTDWALAALDLAETLLGASLAALPEAARAPTRPPWLVPAVLAEWGSGRAPHGLRAPMTHALWPPGTLVRGLLRRWPNAVEAAVGLGRPLGRLPPIALQMAESARRVGLFAARVAKGHPTR